MMSDLIHEEGCECQCDLECDCECDCDNTVTIENVLEYISECDDEDIEEILSAIYGTQTVEDVLKREIITETLKKYTLTQLEEKLK